MWPLSSSNSIRTIWLSPETISACKLMGEIRLDIGPGETNRICAKSVKPGSNVAVAVGSGVVGNGVSVGNGVLVGRGANALAVAKAACPVKTTTVEI